MCMTSECFTIALWVEVAFWKEFVLNFCQTHESLLSWYLPEVLFEVLVQLVAVNSESKPSGGSTCGSRSKQGSFIAMELIYPLCPHWKVLVWCWDPILLFILGNFSKQYITKRCLLIFCDILDLIQFNNLSKGGFF